MTASVAERFGQVRHWMSRNPIAVAPDCPVGEVVGRMRAESIRHVLVMDGERLAGIVSNRDARGLLIEGEPCVSPTSPVARVMTEGPVTTSPEVSLIEAARAMLEQKIGALPVLAGDRVVGILTKSDALEALLAGVETEPGRSGPRPWDPA